MPLAGGLPPASGNRYNYLRTARPRLADSRCRYWGRSRGWLGAGRLGGRLGADRLGFLLGAGRLRSRLGADRLGSRLGAFRLGSRLGANRSRLGADRSRLRHADLHRRLDALRCWGRTDNLATATEKCAVLERLESNTPRDRKPSLHLNTFLLLKIDSDSNKPKGLLKAITNISNNVSMRLVSKSGN